MRPASLSVAVAQLQPVAGAIEENRELTASAIEEAAGRGARLIVLPELCTSGYAGLDSLSVAAAAETLPGGPSLQLWTRLCQRLDVVLVAGLAERHQDAFYNSAVVVGPQGLIATYRKLHLFSFERTLFAPGQGGLCLVETPLGSLGVLICFDLRFPEAVRALALAGCQVLCLPTTWTNAFKPHPYDQQGYCQANRMAAVQAYLNRIYIACADRAGSEGDLRYLGNSCVVGPDGELAVELAGADGSQVLVCEIEPQRAVDKRLGPDNDLFADRRPEAYHVNRIVMEASSPGS